MRFRPHGKGTHELTKNILFHYPQGSYNAEGVEADWQSIFATVSQKLTCSHWCLIEVLDSEVTGTPESLDILKRTYIKLRELGCKLVVIVSQDNFMGVSRVSDAVKNSGMAVSTETDLGNATIAATNYLKTL